MNVNDEVITKDGHIGTITYKASSTKAMENRWCVRFPDNTLGDFNESELKNYVDSIFEGAKFGDRYITRDGRKAIYWRMNVNQHVLVTEDGNCSYCKDNGDDVTKDMDDDIVEKYEESINEDYIKSMEDGYKQGIEAAREWLNDHVQSVAFLDHKFSSIAYPMLGDDFLPMFDKAMEK